MYWFSTAGSLVLAIALMVYAHRRKRFTGTVPKLPLAVSTVLIMVGIFSFLINLVHEPV